MPFDPIYFLIVVAGFIAGIINTLAGSGSLITLPILELLGLPLQVANGTNRIAILLQNIVGIRGFSEKKMLDRNGLRQFGIPSIIGWAIGSYLATIISPDLFRSAFGYIMVFMLFIILFLSLYLHKNLYMQIKQVKYIYYMHFKHIKNNNNYIIFIK